MDKYLKISTSNIDIPFVENFLKDNPSFNISDIFIHETVDGRKRKYTLAYYAVINDKPDLLDYLINSNVNLNVEIYGQSILFSAVHKCDLALLKKSLKAGVHLFVETPTLMTPLGNAILKNNFEIAEYLLDNDANLRTVLNSFQELGYNLMQLAIDSKYDNIVELLVKHNPDFCIEIERSNLNVGGVEKILKTTPDSNINSRFIVKSPRKYSPLTLVHLAVAYRNEELLDWLIKSNADINISIFGHGTALHVALDNNDMKLAKKLIKSGAEINAQTVERSVPLLIYAAQHGNLEMAQYFIDKGANVNDMAIKSWRFNGLSALHIAIRRGFKEFMEFLLNNNANPNIQSLRDRWMPIMYASISEDLDMVKILIARGAICDSRVLDTLRRHKRSRVLEYLMTLDIDAIDILFTSHKVENPILYNVLKVISCVGSAYFARAETFKYGNFTIILDAGYNINSVNELDKPIVEVIDEPKMLNIIKCHIVKTKQAGFCVSQRNIDAVKQGYDDYRTKCDQELIKLKSDKISTSNQTFYGVLHKSFCFLAIRLKHTNIVDVVDKKKLLSAYPIYGGMIYYKLAKAQRRIELLESVEEFLDYILNYSLKLPYTFTRKLYLYLTNENLQKLSSKL